MAGYNHVFIRILIRQAKNSSPTDPVAQQAFLNALVTGIFAMSKQGENSLLSSSINGKSFAFQIPQGMTKTDVMVAAETALEWLESGLGGPVTTIYARNFS